MKWIKNYKVVDVFELIKEIGGDDYNKHEIYKEWIWLRINRCRSNDTGCFDILGIHKEEIPMITEYLLTNDFKIGDKLILWFSW